MDGGRRTRVQLVQPQQRGGALQDARAQALHQCVPGLGLALFARAAAQAHSTQKTVKTGTFVRHHHLTVAHGSGELRGDQSHCSLEPGLVGLRPMHQKLLVSTLLHLRHHSADSVIKTPFMHPATCKSVERNHPLDHGVHRQQRLPAGLLGIFLGLRARRAHLVEQDQHRLVQPLQDLHLCVEVTGILRVFRRVHQVKHHVGGFARGAHGLLAQPKRALAVAVHHLAQKPAQRVARQAQALEQTYRVAKPRRVPQLQRVALGAAPKGVGV